MGGALPRRPHTLRSAVQKPCFRVLLAAAKDGERWQGLIERGYEYGRPVYIGPLMGSDKSRTTNTTPSAEVVVLSKGTAEDQLTAEILDELRRARLKFPGDNVTTLALVEEVGELAKATFEESRERVRQEAVQVATMAMRIVLDSDFTLDGWRASKGLDPLTPLPHERGEAE